MLKAKRIEFFIIKKCINNCIFCSESDRFDGSELALDSVKRTLSGQKKKGVELVHFMGGEPTIHSRFQDILVFSKGLGYRTHIITNGIRFAGKSFCKATVPYLDEIMFSVHGHNARVHNANTRNPESFLKLVKGIDNVSQYAKTSLTATTSITNLNFRHLKKIAALLDKFSIKELQFISIIPSGEGKRNYLNIIPRMLDLKDAIEEVVSFCISKGINARFAGVPMCILGKHYTYSSDLWEEFKIDNSGSHNNKLKLWKEPGIEGKGGFKIDIGRIKTAKCKGCSLNNLCGGIYQKYYLKYGDDELTPFL